MHVPYRGAAPAVNDLLGQQVQMVFLDLPVLLPQIKAGKLKPIAVGAPARVASAPDVPTTAEVGMPGLLTENWYGMVAPAQDAAGRYRRAQQGGGRGHEGSRRGRRNWRARAPFWSATRRISSAPSSPAKRRSGRTVIRAESRDPHSHVHAR